MTMVVAPDCWSLSTSRYMADHGGLLQFWLFPPMCVGEAKATIHCLARGVAPTGVETRELCILHCSEAIDRMRSPTRVKVAENVVVELPAIAIQLIAQSFGLYTGGGHYVAGVDGCRYRTINRGFKRAAYC
jgi:hypothetical protein